MQESKRRPPLHPPTRIATIAFLLTLMFTQFNNCGNYETPDTTPVTNQSVACLNVSCISEAPDNLSISPHLQNGEYSVPANVSEFNIGGDCNEGGFAYNTVHWELTLNGQIVRNSGMQIAQGLTAESKCVNGRFLIYVLLAPITLNNADPVDRTGLATGTGGRAAYSLNITLFGQSAPGAYSTQQAQATVPLNAI